MGRRYDTALFADRIDFIRSRMERPGEPKVFFGIDVIAGLPGETEERFRETFDFIKDRIRPAFLHIFPYSRRPGTRAASMGGQVREGIKTERVEILEDLCSDLHREFVESNRGLKARVLWESDCKDGMMGGYTGNYIRKETAWDTSRIGKIEEVTI
jgi:threonylcarbamoyladenosine tRNA methylthiotransferase MtaB